MPREWKCSRCARVDICYRRSAERKRQEIFCVACSLRSPLAELPAAPLVFGLLVEAACGSLIQIENCYFRHGASESRRRFSAGQRVCDRASQMPCSERLETRKRLLLSKGSSGGASAEQCLDFQSVRQLQWSPAGR